MKEEHTVDDCSFGSGPVENSMRVTSCLAGQVDEESD